MTQATGPTSSDQDQVFWMDPLDLSFFCIHDPITGNRSHTKSTGLIGNDMQILRTGIQSDLRLLRDCLSVFSRTDDWFQFNKESNGFKTLRVIDRDILKSFFMNPGAQLTCNPDDSSRMENRAWDFILMNTRDREDGSYEVSVIWESKGIIRVVFQLVA